MPPHGDTMRAMLLECARRDPGIPIVDAAARLGVSPSTASYHARVLGHERRLCALPSGRRVALFASGDGSCAWMRALLPDLRDAKAQFAAAQLLQGPVQVSALARGLGVSRERAARVLRRLERAGACTRTRSGLARCPAERLACLERAVLRQRCSKQGACARGEREAMPASAARGTRHAQPRHDTLRPSPSGRMSVSTPGVFEASRL